MRRRFSPHGAAVLTLLTGLWLSAGVSGGAAGGQGGWPGGWVMVAPAEAAPVEAAPAEAAPAEAAAAGPLAEFVARTRSASGAFTQRVLRDGHVIETSSGRFAFERPGRFDWEVMEPFEQRLVADGQRLYFYDRDLAQVTIRPLQEALASTPAALLFGQGDLGADFIVHPLPAQDGVQRIEIVPRNPETGFQRIEAGFRAGLPVWMQVDDAFGRIVRFEFHGIVSNPSLPPDRFRFEVPPGAAVIQAQG